MKSRLSSSSSSSSPAQISQIPALFSNAHRAETLRQLQMAGYPVSPEKLPRFQEKLLGFDPEEVEASMPWVAERGIEVHKVYGEFLKSANPFMLTNVSLNTVVDQAWDLGHPAVGKPVGGAARPDGVALNLPPTSTPLTELVELKPKGTALTCGGPAQVAGYQKALQGCGLNTQLMPPYSPLANAILPVLGYGEVEFEGIQDGIVGYTQLRRQPTPDLVPAPELAPQDQQSAQKEANPLESIWRNVEELAEAIEITAKEALALALLLVAIVILGLLLHLPPPVPA